MTRRRALVVAIGAGLAVGGVAWSDPVDPVDRRAAWTARIERLEAEAAAIEAREASVLDELERLSVEVRLRDAVLQRTRVDLEALEFEVDDATRAIARLDEANAERRAWLGYRLREVYKAGPGMTARLALGADDLARYVEGLRYATYLGRRDAEVLRGYRRAVVRLREQRSTLAGRRAELAARAADVEAARAALASARDAERRRLEELRADRAARTAAVAELRAASEELDRRVADRATASAVEGSPALDLAKFRGLLPRPARGDVSAGFGSIVHPRFKTKVPHPGIDIEAPAGDGFRTVFDGEIAYAEWLRGYGLTCIVDHGGGWVSVYAHASALVVAPGDTVSEGQVLGYVGDSGSARGPYLYFELRRDGKPIDPEPWLRAEAGIALAGRADADVR